MFTQKRDVVNGTFRKFGLGPLRIPLISFSLPRPFAKRKIFLEDSRLL